MANTPNFQALRAALREPTALDYSLPKEDRKEDLSSNNPVCCTGKESYKTVTDVKKAQNSVGSSVRFKRFYRCNICGQYHFSRKEEDGRRTLAYIRRSINDEVYGLQFLQTDNTIWTYASLP